MKIEGKDHSKAIMLYNEKKFEKLLQFLKSKNDVYGDDSNYWHIVGVASYSAGEIENAKNAFEKSISLEPYNVASTKNLASIYRQLRDLKKSLKFFNIALSLDDKDHQLQNNAANAYRANGQLELAKLHFQKSLALAPNNPQTTLNYSLLLEEIGDLKNALRYCALSIKLQPNDQAALHLGNLLVNIKDIKYTPELSAIISWALKSGYHVNPRKLGSSLLRFFAQDPNLQDLPGEGDERLSKHQIHSILNIIKKNEALYTLLQITPIHSLEIEKIFLKMRLSIAEIYLKEELKSENLEEALLLVANYFQNSEHVQYDRNFSKIFETLEQKIEEKKKTGPLTESKDIYVLALGRRLTLEDWDSIELSTKIEKNFYKKHYLDVKEEKSLVKKIESLTAITNRSSIKVRAQYTQYPYPSWDVLPLQKSKETLFDYLMKENLAPCPTVANNLDSRVLVAGCGTGQQPISLASKLANTTVVAFDLSETSVAYAKRKAKELDIKNIELYTGDILNLDESHGLFDLISCSGVLHHMHNPESGLIALTKRLKAKGYLNIGLYSTKARQVIFEARKYIYSNIEKTGEKDVQQIRHMLLYSNFSGKNYLRHWGDMYTTSEFVDLILNVQETTYSISDLEELLKKSNLAFCGFQNAHALRAFRTRYPRLDAKNLANWKEFEEEFPNCFTDMYQFWCRKVG